MSDFIEILKWCKDGGFTGPSVILVALIAGLAWKYIPKLFEEHIAFLKSTRETQDKQTVILTRLDEKVSVKLNNHGEAIEHTANGIIAHVDGRPDEAKQLAAKAKEAVK